MLDIPVKDQLNRYLFDSAHVRGELVQVSNTYQEIINNHQYPQAINLLLGELLVATSMLTALLKFEGNIAVQLQGDGPVSVVVVNGNDKQELRGVARFEGDIPSQKLTEMFAKGYMVITITPTQGERYQGIVALDKDTLAECLEAYFEQSEQLRTHFWLRSDGKNAAGMMIQALPDESDDDDGYDRIRQLTDTIKDDELYTLDENIILNRLYHQEDVRIFEPQALSFVCGCSKERSGRAIISIGRQEAESIVEEQGQITMHCDYCNTEYLFAEQDIAELFNDPEQNAEQLH